MGGGWALSCHSGAAGSQGSTTPTFLMFPAIAEEVGGRTETEVRSAEGGSKRDAQGCQPASLTHKA